MSTKAPAPDTSPDWLIDNIAECSKNARAIYLLYLGFLAYCAVTLFGVTDRQIVLNEGVRLPIVNVDVALRGFYFLAPVVAFVLFAYLQLYLQRLRQLKLDLERKHPDVDPKRFYPWMLNIADRPEPGAVGFLQKLVVGFLLWGLLPAVLCVFSFTFLRTHDPVWTWVLSLAPTAGAFAAAYFWYVDGGGISRHWDAAPPFFLFMIGAAATICLLAVSNYSLAGDRERGQTVDLSFQVLVEEQNEEYDVFWLDLRGAQLQGASLTSAVLKKADLDKANLDRATLSDANLREARLDSASLINTDFSSARLDSASLRKARLDGADFSQAWLIDADLFKVETQLDSVNFNGAYLDSADLCSVQLDGADFRNSRLVGTLFNNAQLNGADFRDAYLYKTQFDSTSLNRANLQDAQLVKVDFRGARLVKADLRNAQFDSTRLRGAQLDSANLYGAQLDSTDLFEAQLDSADLSEAHLNGVNLFFASLKGANLTETQLNGADLSLAGLVGAKLAGTQLENKAILKGAWLSGAYLYKTKLAGADLLNAHLDSALLVGTQLQGARLANVDFRGAVLSAIEVDDANLQGAKLDGATFLEVPNGDIIINFDFSRVSDSVRTNVSALNKELRVAFPALTDGEVVELLCRARKLNGIEPNTLRQQLRDKCPKKFEEPEP